MRVDIYRTIRYTALKSGSEPYRIASHSENDCDSFKGSLMNSELSFFFTLGSAFREPSLLLLAPFLTLTFVDACLANIAGARKGSSGDEVEEDMRGGRVLEYEQQAIVSV